MSQQPEERKNNSPTLWQKIERALFLLTFFCTVIGVYYSVRTATKALAQAEITLRPWIAIQNVNTHFEAADIETSIELINLGQSPAYLRVFVSASFDGQSIPPKESPKCVLLPGQSISRDGLKLEGNLFQAFRDGPGDHHISQRIHVQYGSEKNDLRYDSEREVALTSEQFKQILISPSRSGVWKLVEEDYK
jgi:hypothetical protein